MLCLQCVYWFNRSFILIDKRTDCDDVHCCDHYHVLNHPTRSADYFDPASDGYCDVKHPNASTSPDWERKTIFSDGWYRMAEPAGTMMSDQEMIPFQCGTAAAGWLDNGQHPTNVGETINSTVCFSWNGDSCMYETQIQIQYCKNYFLYHLPSTQYCNQRYCATSFSKLYRSRSMFIFNQSNLYS